MTVQFLFRRWSSFVAKETSLHARRSTSNAISGVSILPSHATNVPPRHFLSTKSGHSPTSTDLHSLYLEQIHEIQAEREAVFGPSSDSASDSHDLSHVAEAYTIEHPTPTQSTPPTPSESTSTLSPDWDAEQAYIEREALFQFTAQEKNAWTNHASTSKQSSRKIQLELIQEAIAHDERVRHANTNQHETPSLSSSTFSHLNPHGDGIRMVDVGNKLSTRRIARARSVVSFPPEVLSALERKGKDRIGPKGPIFETARLAGIMGAKRTSDLIPLCHPLPLDRVHIDIELIDNKAIIECECRVTHKTGVEMEALMGASIAALTIYDMVKAVSHGVEIGPTVLVSKSGGKSDFDKQ
ncbi:hypothetical protein HJC23_001494 [Cyclotella cryptica]|uniref:cyclic pyranopterin monophosphate synthase n=1 Tax=Cyclotella cryptica TaxID=29204 RepID=A0ABD3NN08_9STRA|eukprot:CCRYP_020314-RB/>CCRYP_020314-RB protein AED:0.13 eAED:0.13 QI:167/1/1/1/1/1/3/187/353